MFRDMRPSTAAMTVVWLKLEEYGAAPIGECQYPAAQSGLTQPDNVECGHSAKHHARHV